MAETPDPPRPNDDATVLRDAVRVLTQEVRLQGELMKLLNAQLQECRQQLERQGEELHRTRQELALHQGQLARQGEELNRARMELNSRFWRYSAPLRRLLTLGRRPSV